VKESEKQGKILKEHMMNNLIFAQLVEQAAGRWGNVRPYFKSLAKRNNHNLKRAEK
jgi:hypothetical protein